MKKSILETHPLLCLEWNYEKNGTLKPEHVSYGSNKKVWWICKEGHSWEARISNRTMNGRNCPYCANQRPIVGETDLATLNPILAEEWDYEKNGDLTPKDVTAHSVKKVWWICKEKHSWQTTIATRSNGYNCPYCSGQRPIVGETDLATLNPILAEEWDYEKNGDLTPKDVTTYSGKKVWWICKEKHSWQATINHRANGRNCPYCSNKRPIVGKTDLATLNPILAGEWDHEKNGDLMPKDVTRYSQKKVWWICKEKHSWQATIADRSNGNNCPYCSNKRFIVGKTDLATLKPILAEEWDYEKNEDLTPKDVPAHSHKKVWWICKEKHSWQARIKDRTRGRNCPYCSNKRPIVGKTDLATLKPILAKEWDYEKNGDLTPKDVTAHSDKKVWWICKEKHSWQTNIDSRSKGSNCPYCANQRPIVGKTDLATLNPILAQEWDYEKNRDLTPQDVTRYCRKKVWWKCVNGHSWKASIESRNRGTGCPHCWSDG